MATHVHQNLWSAASVQESAFDDVVQKLARKKRIDIGSVIASSDPQTAIDTQGFLDRLADCFARSKELKSDSDHVTATAMVVEHAKKKIKVYIAKNKAFRHAESMKKDHDFALIFFNWLNNVANGTNAESNPDLLTNPLFMKMVEFGTSRLSFYVTQINRAWLTKAKESFDAICTEFLGLDSSPQMPPGFLNALRRKKLAECSILAWKWRRHAYFRHVRKAVKLALLTTTDETRKKSLLQPTDGFMDLVDCLGKLPSAYHHFILYCQTTASGYTFEHSLLMLNDEDASKNILHCELQLLHRFSQPGSEICADYFGCSKRSCWLCWQVLSRFREFNTKGTHSQMYPGWRFPGDHDQFPSPRFVDALTFTDSQLQAAFKGINIMKNLELTAIRHISARLTGEWPGTTGLRRGSAFEWPLIRVDADLTQWQEKRQIRAMLLPSSSSVVQRCQYKAYKKISALDSFASDSIQTLPATQDLGQQDDDLHLAFQLPDWSQNQKLWNYISFPCVRGPYDDFSLLLWFNPGSEGPVNSFLASRYNQLVASKTPLRGNIIVTLAHFQLGRDQQSILIDSDGPSPEDLLKLEQRLRHMTLSELRRKAKPAYIEIGHGFSISPGSD